MSVSTSSVPSSGRSGSAPHRTSRTIVHGFASASPCRKISVLGERTGSPAFYKRDTWRDSPSRSRRRSGCRCGWGDVDVPCNPADKMADPTSVEFARPFEKPGLGTPTGAFKPTAALGRPTMAGTDAKPLLYALEWARKENERPCSQYYHKLDVTKVAVSGQSCGGLMAIQAAMDPKITTAFPYNVSRTRVSRLSTGAGPNPRGSRRPFRRAGCGVRLRPCRPRRSAPPHRSRQRSGLPSTETSRCGPSAAQAPRCSRSSTC